MYQSSALVCLLEQAHMTLEIETTRAIAAQILDIDHLLSKNFHRDMLTVLCCHPMFLCLIYVVKMIRTDRIVLMMLMNLKTEIEIAVKRTLMKEWICINKC